MVAAGMQWEIPLQAGRCGQCQLTTDRVQCCEGMVHTLLPPLRLQLCFAAAVALSTSQMHQSAAQVQGLNWADMV